ncbi:MAG: glutamyl-tRNA reductase [Calditrichaeota bacterium]|nr:glutamyl-tRNA reductase [Calditrichota bacterium]
MDTSYEIYVLGLNHRFAPVEVRETLSYEADEIPRYLQRLLQDDTFAEAFILSTCNRTEIYVVGKVTAPIQELLERFILETRPAFVSRHRDLFYFLEGEAAIRHLFRVAAGLDSMVLGEPQILGQVKEAFQIATEAGSAGTLLRRLFNFTIIAGKRVRSETALGEGAVSVAYAAVELAHKIFKDLSNLNALLIGAGETGELTARHLREKRIGRLYITNRTFSRAEQLAAVLDGTAIPMRQLPEVLREVDLIIGSTSSREFILTRDQVKALLPHRAGRPLFLIDIAVPRDFDPEINRLPNVFLHDIDDLQQIVQRNLEKRREQVPRAEKIVDQEVQNYLNWRKTLQVTPTIVALREKLEAIRQRELEKYRHRVSPEEFEHLKRVTHGIINKILHLPIVQLKKYNNGNPDGLLRIDVVRELFDLEDDDD